MTKVGLYEVATAKAIKDRVLGQEKINLENIPVGKAFPEQPFWAVLLEDLDVASDPRNGWSTANARRLRRVNNTGFDLEEVPGDIGIYKVVNRSLSVDAPCGTFGLVVPIQKVELSFHPDCAAISGYSECEPSE